MSGRRVVLAENAQTGNWAAGGLPDYGSMSAEEFAVHWNLHDGGGMDGVEEFREAGWTARFVEIPEAGP